MDGAVDLTRRLSVGVGARRDGAIYMPALPALEGEFRALASLADGDAAVTVPLIEIGPPSTPRPVGGLPAAAPKPLESHITDRLVRLADSWRCDDEVLIDFANLPADIQTGGRPAVDFMLEFATSLLTVTPVTSPSRSLAAQLAAGAHMTDRIAVRARPHDLAAKGRPVLDLLDRLAVDPNQVELIVDAGPLVWNQTEATAQLLRLLNEVPEENWLRVVCLAGSFPDPLSEHVRNGALEHFPRSDWLAWTAIRRIGVPTMPSFGDYVVFGPDAAVGGSFAGARSMRFTGPSTWAVQRGAPAGEKVPSSEFFTMAARMRRTREYQSYAPGHCPGCERLAAASGGSGIGPGNATTWVEVAVGHHLAAVARDVTAVAVAA